MLSNRILIGTLLSAALGSAACSGTGASPLEPTSQPAFSSAPEAGGGGDQEDEDWGETKPSSCKPLSARTESEDIGPWGGVLELGPHRLIVPPGALLKKTRITGRISADSVNSVQLFPKGLQFLVPVRLQLSYRNCENLELKNMRVVYTSDDLLRLLELIPSEDRKGMRTVVGFISHFSRYAVAY